MIVRELKIVYGRQLGEVEPTVIQTPDDVARLLQEVLADEPQEVFCALMLDTRLRVTSVVEVSRGTISASLVHPREVFKGAILCNARAIIVAHNHPSGVAVPSTEDKAVTRRLVKAGKLLGIQVCDHVIVGEDDTYSFDAHGEL